VQKNLFLLILCAILGVMSCKGTMDLTPTDLKAKGVPLSIMAPKGATITSEDLAGMTNVTIQKDKYDVQIIGLMSTAASAAEIVTEKKNELTSSDPTFKIITDDEDGMVYETKTDGDAYNFYFVKQIADKFYTFQTGFTALPTLAEVKEMYAAVRAAK
jgi:hypothetical protein